MDTEVGSPAEHIYPKMGYTAVSETGRLETYFANGMIGWSYTWSGDIAKGWEGSRWDIFLQGYATQELEYLY